MAMSEIYGHLPFLKDDPKYEVGKYFRIEAANEIWKKQYKDKTFDGIDELELLIVQAMDELYDHNVKHQAKLTGQYGKVACTTPGCKFEVWYKPFN